MKGMLMTFYPTRRRRLLAASAIAAALSAIGGGALAQDAPVQTAAPDQVAPAAPADPREAKIEALEHEIQDLAAQVADLKASTAASVKDVRASQAALPKVTLAAGRPTFTTADGKFSASIRAIVQFDAARYSVSPLTAANDLSSGTNFRRARLGVDGKAFGDWNYALWADFGGSGGETPVLNQAYIEYAGWKPFGAANPVRLRVGAWATPTGLEDATSNTEGLFLERPAAAELVRNIAGGDGRSGVGFFANGDHWYASGTLTGAVVGVPATAEFTEQTGYLARIAFNPLHGADYDVHVGANIQGVIDPADTAAGPPVAQAIRLRERPELRVDGARLVDTGNINANGLTAYGGELGASWRNIYVAGEAYKIDVDRSAVTPALFNPSFSGWYVQGAWTLTGERHQWSSANGGFRGIRPDKTLDPSKGNWGAFEIAARYSVLDLNDLAGIAGHTAPAGGVRGGEQKITTVGLNWYPNSVIRFLLDYQWANIQRLNAAGGQIGETVDTASFRAQVAF